MHSDEWQCTLCSNADDMVLAEIEKKDLTMGPGKRKAPSGLTEKELKVWETFSAIYWLSWSSIRDNLRTILSNVDDEFWIKVIGAITVWLNTNENFDWKKKPDQVIQATRIRFSGIKSSMSYLSFSNQFCPCNAREDLVPKNYHSSLCKIFSNDSFLIKFYYISKNWEKYYILNM